MKAPQSVIFAAAVALGWASCGDAGPPADGAVADARDAVRDGAFDDTGGGWPDLMPHVDRPDPCATDRKAVEAEMSAIKQCHQPLDCTSMAGVCPFGCHIAYNKTEDPSKLVQLIATYKANKACVPCSRGCQPPRQLTCAGGRCKVSSRP